MRAGPLEISLKVDEHEYLFDVVTGRSANARNLDQTPAERLNEMRAAWQAWDATMPPHSRGRRRASGLRQEDMP